MTTVNDFVDILRIIREQPEWGEALRSALLSKEVLELPQRLAEFSEAANRRFDRLEGDVADLKEGQARLEGDVSVLKTDVAELKEGQARLEGDVSILKTDVADLKEGQTRLEGDVSVLKTDVADLKEGQTRLEGTVGGLGVKIDNLEGSVTRLEGQYGNLRGNSYEQKIGGIVSSIMTERMNIRVRVLKRVSLDDDSEFFDLLYGAEERGIISQQERNELASADIVLQERGRRDSAPLHIVMEVSITVADHDIIRSAERAAIMQRVTEERVIPVVVGANLDDARRQLARERNVTLITVSE